METKTKTYEVKSKWYDPLSWFRTKTETETYFVTTIRTGAVKSAFRDLRNSIEQEIRGSNFNAMQGFKDKVPKEIIPALRKSIIDNGGDETSININRLRYILQSIIYSINLPDISYTNHRLPEGSGTLEGSAAETFIEESRNFIDTLQDEVKKDIIKHANSIINTLEEVELGNENSLANMISS